MAKLLGLFLGCFLLILSTTRLQAQEALPPLHTHPLPLTLAPWSDSASQDNYLSSLETTPVGALVWSQFPIKVYWDKPDHTSSPAENQRSEQWSARVAQALAEWQPYLPLVAVEQAEAADIVIRRSSPPLGSYFHPDTGKLVIPPARSAQTRYDLYRTKTQPPLLAHRMTILISPGLSESLLLSAARHELGHALGIWGHSPSPNDALFFSQVRTSAAISERDVHTLVSIYQQPTRLGWPILK